MQQINTAFNDKSISNEQLEEEKWEKVIGFMKENPKMLIQMMNMMEEGKQQPN